MSLYNCVTIGKLLSLSDLQFPSSVKQGVKIPAWESRCTQTVVHTVTPENKMGKRPRERLGCYEGSKGEQSNWLEWA